MREGRPNTSRSLETFVFDGRVLTTPLYGSDDYAVIRDHATKQVFYRGPGRHEVFPPTEVHGRGVLVESLLAWVRVNGWHDLQVCPRPQAPSPRPQATSPMLSNVSQTGAHR